MSADKFSSGPAGPPLTMPNEKPYYLALREKGIERGGKRERKWERKREKRRKRGERREEETQRERWRGEERPTA